MKVKFNKYERVAGLFVLVAIVGALAATAAVAIKQGWLERKVRFQTVLNNADGLRLGTQVQMAGLRVGSVTSITLTSNSEVRLQFEVSDKFHERVRADSVVRAIRPFIIGEKVLDVSVGSASTDLLAEHSVVKSEATADIMDLISGRTLAPYLEAMGKTMENLRFVAQAILDPERSKSIVRIFDELAPLVKNVNGFSSQANALLKQINGKKQLSHVIDNLVALTGEMNRVLPVLTKDSPRLAEDVTKIARNMAILTDEMQKILPALQEIGPELPRASRRAIEALDETVVTLKALQKSFILRGSVEDVKKEERTENEARLPAGSEQAEQTESGSRRKTP